MVLFGELTEIKEALDTKGIKYEECIIPEGAIFVYVNGLMQIQKPTEEQRGQFWPYIRISLHEGDSGYYVRACGMIYENQTIDDILELINMYV